MYIQQRQQNLMNLYDIMIIITYSTFKWA